jgi:cathepsin L
MRIINIALLSVFVLAGVVFASRAPRSRGKYYPPTRAGFNSWREDTINDEIDFAGLHRGDVGTIAVDSSRFDQWLENHRFIAEHNAKYRRGESKFHLTLNKFAALSNAEFRQRHLNRKGKRQAPVAVAPAAAAAPTFSHVAESDNVNVDWVAKGYIGPVLNQGQCGSCWSFSAAEAMAGRFNQYMIDNKGTMPQQCVQAGRTCYGANKTCCVFSPQELVDCTDVGGCQQQRCGCSIGGEPHDAIDWIAWKQGGKINTLAQYPYVSGNTQHITTCAVRPNPVNARVKGYSNVSGINVAPWGSEQKLLSGTQRYSTISVGVDASSLYWQFYGGGILSVPGCNNTPDGLDHAVLLVGALSSSPPTSPPTPPGPPPGPSNCDKQYYEAECLGEAGCYWCNDATAPNFFWCQNFNGSSSSETCITGGGSGSGSSGGGSSSSGGGGAALSAGAPSGKSWIVMNSWGNWGAAAGAAPYGFVYLERGNSANPNMCGVATDSVVVELSV